MGIRSECYRQRTDSVALVSANLLRKSGVVYVKGYMESFRFDRSTFSKCLQACIFILLLCCGDIESNPGPLSKETGPQYHPGDFEQEQAQACAPEVVHHEGWLTRKYDWESRDKQSSSRSWNRLFMVLHGASLSCYKDQKHAKSDPNSRIHHEPTIDLTGADCQVARDYTKRPYVLRITLATGGEYLFQAKDQNERDVWVNRINMAIGEEGANS